MPAEYRQQDRIEAGQEFDIERLGPGEYRLVRRAPRPNDGVVDWTRPATRIHDLIRGLYPWPHAFTFYRGRRLILLGSAAEKGSGVFPDPIFPGTILHAEGDRLQLATGDGTLAINRIQAEGRRPMTTREFLAGHPLDAGRTLTPHP